MRAALLHVLLPDNYIANCLDCACSSEVIYARTLSVLYPIYASTFVWAALISLAAYGTPIKPINIGGMLLLIAGMVLMGK